MIIDISVKSECCTFIRLNEASDIHLSVSYSKMVSLNIYNKRDKI